MRKCMPYLNFVCSANVSAIVEKLDAMCYQFSEAELDVFHQIKAAFDPHSLLNPGKAVPTLHRCAELGSMHVHHGNLPHPELERF